MVQQSDSLNRLIDDLSGILNKNVAPFGVKKEPVSSEKMITEAINSVQGIAQQKKNLISHSLSSTLPVITVDEFRIKQVIINLLTNAIKFSHDDGTIFVNAGVVGNDLLVQVVDHGIGMPVDELAMLFNPHRELIKGRDDIHGDGLGLNISRQIVEAHGGNIWAESVEGSGSKFNFTLPITTPI
jgi:two-component system phosphate regulon sensor histidine kinase PhoR